MAAGLCAAALVALPAQAAAQEPGETWLLFRTDGRTYIYEEPQDDPLTYHFVADLLDFASGAVVGSMEALILIPDDVDTTGNPPCGSVDGDETNLVRNMTVTGDIWFTLPDGTLHGRVRVQVRRDPPTERDYYYASQDEFVGTGRYEHTQVTGIQAGWELIVEPTNWQALQVFTVTDPYVAVGGAGNAADTTGFGSVADDYGIGRHEVSVRQYVHFLNAVAATDSFGLFDDALGADHGITRTGVPGDYSYWAEAGREEHPATHVSLYDAMRYVNWCENGRPRGAQDASTTEDGAYTITQSGIDANSIVRNAGSLYALPSEDEWYKAAHYAAAAQSYFLYPAGDDSLVCAAPESAPAHAANCGGAVGGTSEGGGYAASPSPNGTFDQGGNAWEWTEDASGPDRRIRGGSFASPVGELAAATSGLAEDPLSEGPDLGFRVNLLPEPGGSLGLLAGALALAGAHRLRSRRPTPGSRRPPSSRRTGIRGALVAALVCGSAAAAGLPARALAQDPGSTWLAFRTEGRTYIYEEPQDDPLTYHFVADLLDFTSGAVVGSMEALILLPEDIDTTGNPPCGSVGGEETNLVRNLTVTGDIWFVLPDGTLQGRVRVHVRRDPPTGRDYYYASQDGFVGTGRYENARVKGIQAGWELIVEPTNWQAIQVFTVTDP